MQAENVNAAVVSKRFDCSGERFKEKAARKELRVAISANNCGLQSLNA
jgi:hypothetical protein